MIKKQTIVNIVRAKMDSAGAVCFVVDRPPHHCLHSRLGWVLRVARSTLVMCTGDAM